MSPIRWFVCLTGFFEVPLRAPKKINVRQKAAIGRTYSAHESDALVRMRNLIFLSALNTFLLSQYGNIYIHKEFRWT